MVDLKALHPYHPAGLDLPHYKAPTLTTVTILAIFFAFVAVLLAVSYTAVSTTKLPRTRRLLFLWFVTCGFIHFGLEGYFAWNSTAIAGQDHVLAQLWKEYALSDSRYMSNDSFVVIMESVTAFVWGPLSFLTAYLIFTDSPASPIFEFLVSTGQLYGDVLYYATTLFEGSPHCSPTTFHFWFYFVGMNAPWIVIPSGVMLSAGRRMTAAVTATHGKGRKKTL
ncbi:hypothetical protein HKX48_007648 [Thoreauomyces humboldtii]|nr:hypothetical protein HKX48_007648 [Thoreauomyces humboldtii]